MARPQLTERRMTMEEYLAWEATQDQKHEFVDGYAYGMAGANEAHNIIQGNLFAAAHGKLRGTPCRPFPSDMKVQTGNGRARYPDVTIDCGPRNPGNLIAPEPRVVFEVLSPETQKDDRTIKLADYNATETILHYVLVEPSEPLVHVYTRRLNAEFDLRPEEIRGLEATVELPRVPLTLTMAEIYEELEFPEAQA